MSVTRISNWSESANGSPIELFHTAGATLSELQNPILFIGGVHGDEPEGVRLADDTLGWLKVRQPVVNSPDWVLIPCLNPDGFKSRQRVNGNGVDLNRNFPSQSWSENYEKERYYPGTQPASESETASLVELIELLHPEIIVHCHSWKPCIVYSGLTHPDFVKDLSEHSGYASKDDIGYETPGSLGDYGWQTRNISVVCIEEQEEMNLDCVWPHFNEPIKQLFSGKYRKVHE